MNKKITCSTVLFCQKTEVDKESGLLSLIHLTSSVFVTVSAEELDSIGKTPRGTNMPLEIVIVWDKIVLDTSSNNEKITFDCFIDFIDPKGEVVMKGMKLSVAVPAETDRYYSIFSLPKGIVTALPGRHMFRISMTDGSLIFEQPFFVNMIETNGLPIENSEM